MKWMGMCFILVGCIGMELWYSNTYIKKWKNLMELQKAFVILKGEIAYGRTPLPEAFFRVADKTMGTISYFFKRMAEGLEEGQGAMEPLWKWALKECIPSGEMRDVDRKELERMGSTLGYLDAEMQLQTIGLYEKQLQQSICFYEKEKENRTRLYPMLGTIAGVLLCIIMI